MPASSEFVDLCQSQVELLTQGLGAALSAVYLTEELVDGDNAKLIPIVVYPQTTAVERQAETQAQEKVAQDQFSSSSPFSHSPSSPPLLSPYSLRQKDDRVSPALNAIQPKKPDKSLKQQRQIVLPLIHEGVVMGLLVTGREDRPWNKKERATIEKIAHTLASACVMDHRRAWFEQQLSLQRRLEAQKRDLLDDLLHQFRNPLTALKTFSKLLVKRLITGDPNREVASSIARETERLQELLQRFDQTINLEAEEVPLNTKIVTAMQPVEVAPLPLPLLPAKDELVQSPPQLCLVAEVLEPLIDSATAIAQERNLNLTAIIVPNLPPVQANAKALCEVLSNLIDNALKYTPALGNILIQAGLERSLPTGEFQGIAISDSGVGIPSQDLEHIFERHYRGVQAQSDIPGTGLGLAIAKELVKQMHGEIQVFSPALHRNEETSSGVGTTFIVWLPYSNNS